MVQRVYNGIIFTPSFYNEVARHIVRRALYQIAIIETQQQCGEMNKEKCDICNTEFASPAKLDEHIRRVHKDMKKRYNYRCNYCHKKFTSQLKYDGHVDMQHGNLREDGEYLRHRCLICSKFFDLKLSYYTHIVKEHRVNICDICLEEFPDQPTLAQHIKDKHPKQKGLYINIL